MGIYAPSHILPFPRGTTLSMLQGKSGTDADQLVDAPGGRQDLEGKLFVVEDTIAEKEVELLLRVVRNSTTSPMVITSAAGIPNVVTLAAAGTDLVDYPKVAVAFSTAVLGVHRIVDPAYRGKPSFSVPPGDLFYIVEKGHCYARSSGAISRGNLLGVAANNRVAAITSGAVRPIGVSLSAASTDDTEIRVYAGLDLIGFTAVGTNF